MFDFNGNGEIDAFDMAITMEILDEDQEKDDDIFSDDLDDEEDE